MILAGGGSMRYGGRPKGLESISGVRIIDRVAAALRAATEELLLIANAAEAVNWLPGVAVAGDVRVGEGALGGLHAALARAGTDVLLVAWDMPFVSAALLRTMRARGEAEGVDAVLPEIWFRNLFAELFSFPSTPLDLKSWTPTRHFPPCTAHTECLSLIKFTNNLSGQIPELCFSKKTKPQIN